MLRVHVDTNIQEVGTIMGCSINMSAPSLKLESRVLSVYETRVDNDNVFLSLPLHDVVLTYYTIYSNGRSKNSSH